MGSILRRAIDKAGSYRIFLKYSIVGFFVTGVDFAIFLSFLYVLSIPPVPSKVAAFLGAMTVSYGLNRVWTFRARQSLVRRQFPRFLAVSVIGLALSAFFIHLLVVRLFIHPVISNGITSGIVLTWNFLANKYLTFRILNRRDFRDEPAVKELSLVIPAYNEEHRIGKTLSENLEFLSKQPYSWEMIVVDDGSHDNTVNIVGSIVKDRPDSVRLLRLPRNRGKGAAVQMGVMNAAGRYVIMADADNATPIEEIGNFLREARDDTILIGSRYVGTSNVERKQSGFRVLIGRLGNLVISLFLLEGIRDTQCGFKMFPLALAKDLFSRQRIQGWGFDMEILTIAQGMGIPIREKGVTWRDIGGSRLRPVRAAVNTFLELVKIKVNVWSGLYE
jgi:dolichyl-phosphate beta-glucosyltransferase